MEGRLEPQSITISADSPEVTVDLQEWASVLDEKKAKEDKAKAADLAERRRIERIRAQKRKKAEAAAAAKKRKAAEARRAAEAAKKKKEKTKVVITPVD